MTQTSTHTQRVPRKGDRVVYTPNPAGAGVGRVREVWAGGYTVDFEDAKRQEVAAEEVAVACTTGCCSGACETGGAR